jgi:hypothetical protein
LNISLNYCSRKEASLKVGGDRYKDLWEKTTAIDFEPQIWADVRGWTQMKTRFLLILR